VGSVLKSNYETIFPSQNVSAQEIDRTISGLIASNKACI
jgi:hypothetical protein